MSFGKTSLALAAALTMASGAAAVSATLTPAQVLASKIEQDLISQQTASTTPLTDAQIQQTIATDLALSTDSLADKEAALQLVEVAAGLPTGTATDAGTALAALEATGNFVAASGGGALGGASFGANGTADTGGASYKSPA